MDTSGVATPVLDPGWNSTEMRKLCLRDTLNDVIKNFYKAADISKVKDLLYTSVPEYDTRHIKHKKVDNALVTMFNILQGILRTIHLCLLLSTLRVDSATLMCEQDRFKQQCTEILVEQAAMKDQLSTILRLLECRDRGSGEASTYNKAGAAQISMAHPLMGTQPSCPIHPKMPTPIPKDSAAR